MFKKNQKGFTLIELLIVIAIIAILAAIAIPQFAAYRIRGFNSSSESDARNWKTTQEAGNSSFFSYMNSAQGIIPVGAPAIGAGALLQGPMTAATTATAGAFLQTPFVATRVPAINLVMGAIGIGVGNNVNIASDSVVSATDPNIAATAQVFAKHFEGDTVFFVDMDSTAIYWCKNSDLWIKVAYPALPGYAAPGNNFGIDDGNGIACGGVPIANWVAL